MVETGFRVHGRTSTSESQESPAALLRKIFRETQALGCRLGGLSKREMTPSWLHGLEPIVQDLLQKTLGTLEIGE